MNIFEKFYFDKTFDGTNNITRWNNSRRIKDESVALHSYIVTQFADFLVERLMENAMYPNISDFSCYKLKVIRSAMRHDFDENISGDMLYTVKSNEFNGNELAKSLQDFIDFKMNKIYDDLDSDREKVLLKNSICYYDDKSVKAIVKVCDWLACLFYIYKERQLGNQNFNDRFETCKEQTKNWIKISKVTLLGTKFIFTKQSFDVFDEIEILLTKI